MLTCSACGQENPTGARFCNACGAALGGVGGEVRKTVTVLFADVTGSTALGERLDPESFRRVMARYFDAARRAVERHGGTVEKFIGDAVMAVFGVPTIHEDDALRALRAAADLRHALGALNEELERDYGVSLEVRVGVNTGEVVTGTAERLATGDAVNVAARLQQAAEPGEILVGEPTLVLARDAVEAELLPPVELKGKTEPITPFRLLRVVEGAEAERRLDAPLIGRREELEAVRASFDDAVAARRCRLVTVYGPPGIGKSRLSREVASALAADASVLTGRCLPYGEGITYWPLREIFAAVGAEEELSMALASDAPDEVFWAVRKALEQRARERPLALIVEDIHWAEPTLLDLIEHLHDWTRDAPLLVLCLSRPELRDARPGWAGEALTLQPLSEGESEELIEALLGDAALDAGVRSRIREVAEGNPLFVEQLLAMLAEGGDPERVPATIQALLAARLDALPDDERSVIERASVIGLEFEWDALGELAPDRRRSPGAVLSALVRKELIRPHEAIEDTFRFRHMLIRDAAYDRIPKEVRTDLHERVAAWLDRRGEEFDEIVGYHLEQAYGCLADLGPLDDRGLELAEHAAERLGESGKRAFARGDMPAAAGLLERAVALPRADVSPRLQLLPMLGRALIQGGEWNRADHLLSEAAQTASAADEPTVAAKAAVELVFLRMHMDTGGWNHQRARAELEGPIGVFEQHGDRAGLARALMYMGLLLCWSGRAAAGVEEIGRAARYAQEAGDHAQEAESLEYVINFAVHGPMPVPDALALIEDARARVRRHPRFEVAALGSRSWFEAALGRFDEARALIAHAKATARELGLSSMLAYRLSNAESRIELLAGDMAAAERVLRPACEELVRIGDLGHLCSNAPDLVDALYAQGRADEGWSWIELVDGSMIDEDMDAQIAVRRVKAKLLAHRGDLEDAERVARQAIDLGARTDFLDLRARAFGDLAEVLRLAGKTAEAALAVEEAIRLHELKGNVVAPEELRGLLAEV
jgi:class 3 adenylate cyclase/tetratricopeptide (TPR) repeat protein